MDKVILAAKLVFSGNELPDVGKKTAGPIWQKVNPMGFRGIQNGNDQVTADFNKTKNMADRSSLTVKQTVDLLKTVGNFDLYKKDTGSAIRVDGIPSLIECLTCTCPIFHYGYFPSQSC
jgi:hypothetical protein